METIAPTKKSTSAWPYGIVGAFVLFISFFIYIVSQVYQGDYSLVSQNSYYEGLKYQDRIDAIERANQLGVELRDIPGKQVMLLTIPNGAEKAMGQIHFYRSSDSDLDFTIPIKLDAKNQQLMGLKQLKEGPWMAKVTFEMDQQVYYSEYGFNR